MMAALAVGVESRSLEATTDQYRAALNAFDAAIGEYAELHRRLEETLPALPSTAQMHAMMLNRAQLAYAIRAARPNARHGDIFTPQVEQLFRHLIDRALTGRDAELLLRDLFEEHLPVSAWHPNVYDAYPDEATHDIPLILLQYLPALPDDIEYRLIDHDLVLWDIHADLIVDVLRDAIPRPTA
jgi:hypothetical protein